MEITKQKIPLTIVTGFLGSGKTTLLQKILKDPGHGRIAVIENEYGSLGLDHHLLTHVEENMVIVQNGCVCCTVRSDVIEALVSLEKRRDMFDSIVIETTGLADPVALSQTLLADPRVNQIVRIDSVVTLVDANLFETNFADQLSEFQSQIAFADVIVLSKVDLISASLRDAVISQIEFMNAAAKIVTVTKEEADTRSVIGLGLFDSKIIRLAPRVKKSLIATHHPHTQVFSGIIEVEGEIDPDKFHVLIEMFAGVYASQIYRMKGVFRVKGEKNRALVQIVRHIVTVEDLKIDLDPGSLNQFVVIAKTPEFVAVAREWLKYAASSDDLVKLRGALMEQKSAAGSNSLQAQL